MWLIFARFSYFTGVYFACLLLMIIAFPKLHYYFWLTAHTHVRNTIHLSSHAKITQLWEKKFWRKLKYQNHYHHSDADELTLHLFTKTNFVLRSNHSTVFGNFDLIELLKWCGQLNGERTHKSSNWNWNYISLRHKKNKKHINSPYFSTYFTFFSNLRVAHFQLESFLFYFSSVWH